MTLILYVIFLGWTWKVYSGAKITQGNRNKAGPTTMAKPALFYFYILPSLSKDSCSYSVLYSLFILTLSLFLDISYFDQ